jgi:hypothetical protein
MECLKKKAISFPLWFGVTIKTAIVVGHPPVHLGNFMSDFVAMN